VVNNGSAFFNPVIDPTNFPDLWYGSCTINAPGSVVGFVQMRTIGTDLAAAYEAINASSSDKVAFAPLVGKMLANGFATVLTIQNLSTTSDAHVTVDYVPSAEYIASGGSATTITIPSFTIPAGGSVLHNHRLASGANSVPGLPAGWYGSAKVTSADQPVSGFMQLTNINPSGDTTMAHDLFTRAS
jgi:hypothetical protein